MQLSEIRVCLCPPDSGRLRAFCSLTFDSAIVIRDVKLIEGNDGLFLAMPSRKLCDRCRRCGEKNHLRARFCNQCGGQLDDARALRPLNGIGHSPFGGRVKLHADIAHPINPATRLELERRVLMAYHDEVERSRLPGYVAPRLDLDLEGEDLCADQTMRLRPTGTDAH